MIDVADKSLRGRHLKEYQIDLGDADTLTTFFIVKGFLLKVMPDILQLSEAEDSHLDRKTVIETIQELLLLAIICEDKLGVPDTEKMFKDFTIFTIYTKEGYKFVNSYLKKGLK